ncbi:sigma-54 dependent transcriptional regulator [soil metagenome]
MKILVLDADRETVRTLEPQLTTAHVRAGYGAPDLQLASTGRWDLVLLDEEFCGAGLDLLTRLHADDSMPPVVLLSQHPTMDLALEAIRRGAYDVLPKPPPVSRLLEILLGLGGSRRLHPLPVAPPPADAVVGSSPEMLTIFKAIARAATSDATVLLLGESGSGKEMVARALHARSRRAQGPFVAINCAAIPEHLLESELFGHEKGAFTGAIGRRIGRFERANKGTLFLDEIGDMSFALQSKILRAIQEREVERVGGTAPVPIDVRIVAATHRDLAEAVREGNFREDLFYRLAVVALHLPALRERGTDLDLLVEHFVAFYAREHGHPIRAVAEEAIDVLRRYSWPGNIRQLRNVAERAVVMADGDVLLPQHLPPELLRPPESPQGSANADEPLCTLGEMERRMIVRALRESDNNHTVAASVLGIHRNTLRRKLAEYGIAEA